MATVMSPDLQLWIVVACVVLAGWRVALRVRRGLTVVDDAGSCGGGCHGCPPAATSVDQPVVQLDLFRQP